MTFQIHRGLVSNVDKTMGFRAGSSTFSLDDPSVIYYSPSPVGGLPLNPGDYVAVAVTRTRVPSAKLVALAYRKLGTAESAHTLNAWWPALCVVLGATAAVLWGTDGVNHLNSLVALLVFASLAWAFGSFAAAGIVRLKLMRSACVVLNALDSLATH